MLLAAMLAAPVHGQVIREGLNKIRQQGLELMLTVYRRADVAEYCEKNPEAEFTIQVNGPNAEYTVHCPTRREFLALIEQQQQQAPR